MCTFVIGAGIGAGSGTATDLDLELVVRGYIIHGTQLAVHVCVHGGDKSAAGVRWQTPCVAI